MSGKRVVLVMAALLALYCIGLAVLVWRGTRTPHYQRLPEAATDDTE